jgi:hypothetical protein
MKSALYTSLVSSTETLVNKAGFSQYKLELLYAPDDVSLSGRSKALQEYYSIDPTARVERIRTAGHLSPSVAFTIDQYKKPQSDDDGNALYTLIFEGDKIEAAQKATKAIVRQSRTQEIRANFARTADGPSASVAAPA